MIVGDYRELELEHEDQLFPKDVLNHPWVLFHGTSNVAAQSIERDGLRWNSDLYTKGDVERVLSIFRQMDWLGLGSDAYVALARYAVDIDFKRGPRKPIFFTQFPAQAIGYTQRHRVGGETAGCLLYALENLRQFLDNEDVRTEFRRSRFSRIRSVVQNAPIPPELAVIDPNQANADQCRKLAAHLDSLVGHQVVFPSIPPDDPSKPPGAFAPWEIDCGWLKEELRGLVDLENRLRNAIEEYAYGVIYAVDFTSLSHDALQDLGRHGFAFHNPIPTANIVSAAYISARQRRLPHNRLAEGHQVRVRHGIVGAVMDDSERRTRVELLENFSPK